METLFKQEEHPEELEQGMKHLYNKYSTGLKDISYVSDLQSISADFLIYNIDTAFNLWRKPYANHLNFNDFCEYILPYRVGNEPLCDWREEFQEYFIPAVYSRIPVIKDSVTANELCNAIKTYPYSTLSRIVGLLPDYNVHTLSIMRIGNCSQYSSQAIMAARNLEIPICIDYTHNGQPAV